MIGELGLKQTKLQYNLMEPITVEILDEIELIDLRTLFLGDFWILVPK